MPLPVPKAELIGSTLELIGYGAYLIIFLQCLQVLYKKYTRGHTVGYLLCTAITIFVLVTIHLVVDVVRFMAAFSGNMDIPNAPATYYGNVNSPLDLTKTAVYVTVTLISDGLILYRTFTVWGSNYLIAVIPFLLFMADIATSAWFTWSLNQVKPGDDVLVANVTLRSKYFYIVTLVLNLICSFLISWKIWTIQRRVSGFAVHASRLTNIVTVILESAAIYSVWLIVLIAVSTTGDAAIFVMLNCISPVIGMVFSVVIIRVLNDRLHITTDRTGATTSFSLPRVSRRKGSAVPNVSLSAASDGSGTLAGSANDGVQINLETIVHADGRNYDQDSVKVETGSGHFDHGKGDSLA